MKPNLLVLLSIAYLSVSRAAAATDADALKALSFIENERQTIQSLVSNPDSCTELMSTAVAASLARKQTGNSDINAAPKPIDDCQTVSLNHDGSLQVLCLVKFADGHGPMRYVAVFKHSGLLDAAELPLGSSTGELGPVSLSLEDINHDGRLEVVDRERSGGMNGQTAAKTDPAPMVTNIWVWRNNNFVCATYEFRSYLVLTVLPGLRGALLRAQSPMFASRNSDKEISGLRNSIDLTNRFLATGHY